MAKPSPFDYALLAGIGLCWGSQFVFNRLAIDSMPPLMVATGRVVIGCSALTAFLWMFPQHGRQRPGQQRKQPWSMYCAIGMAEAIIPCFLIPWGQQHVNSSIAAILMATIPIFTLLLAPVFVKDEHWSLVATLSVLIGFCGVVVLIAPQEKAGQFLGDMIGALAILGGALSFAVSLIMMKRLPNGPSVLAIRNVFLTASVPLLIVTLIWHQPWKLAVTIDSIVALVSLGILCGAVAYVMYIFLLHRMGPTFTSLCNYLVTLVGVLIGTMFLGNKLEPHDIVALALILSALAINQLRQK